MKVILVLLICCLSCPVLAREDDAAKHPDWSPDGCQLTFEAVVGGVSNVYIAELKTAKATQLSHTEAMDSYPRFTRRSAHRISVIFTGVGGDHNDPD